MFILLHNIKCFYFDFLRLVYPMLPVSLDYPFCIALSLFSTVYKHLKTSFRNYDDANKKHMAVNIWLS